MKHNIIICGEVGCGKTYSIRSIIENTDKTVFLLATEPGWEQILGDIPKDRLKVHYVTPSSTDWSVLENNAKLINRTDMAALQKLPMNRSKYQQFIEVLATMANFTDDRDEGKEYGAVDSWEEDRVFILDGLSGISTMAIQLVVGAKPIKTQPEWGVGMDILLKLSDKLCADTKCSFVLLAHVEKQLDEFNGGTIKTISTLGNKLAPEIIKPYDEIIYAERRGSDFIWSTTERGVTLKTRTLGWGDEFPQNFGVILNKETLL